MLRMLTSHWRLALKQLDKICFNKNIGRQYTKFQDLHALILRDVNSPSQLHHYMKAIKTLQLNTYNLFRSVVLIHIYLQEIQEVDEAKVMDFLNYLLLQCNFLIKTHSEIESKGAHKYDIIKTQMSTREDQMFLCKEIFLISSVIKSYIGYTCKLVTMFAMYKKLKVKPRVEQYEGWMIINLLKIITGFTNHFTMIGRYFIKEFGILVILIMKVITKDIVMFSDTLKVLAFHQNCILTCANLEDKDYQMEIEEFMKMLNEIAKLNEALIQVYFGKYFYAYLCNLKQPSWININDSEFDTFFKIFRAYKAMEENQEKAIKEDKGARIMGKEYQRYERKGDEDC